MRNIIMLALVAAAVCGAALWLLLDDSPPREDDAFTSLSTHSDNAADQANNPSGQQAQSEASALLPLVSDVPEVAPPIPESYRRALGGLKGRVVEIDGTPVPELNLALVGASFFDIMKPLNLLSDDPAGEFDPVLAEMVTDSEGRFIARDLETRVVGGLIVDPNGPRSSLHVLDYSPSSGVLHDLGDIVLQGGVTLRGHVLDERQTALAGVRVRSLPLTLPPGMFPDELIDLRPEGGLLIDTGSSQLGSITYRPPAAIARLERLLPLPTTHTNTEGYWELIGVPSGAPLLLFDDGVHVSRSKSSGPTGPVGSEVDMGDLLLFDGVTLSGRVVDSQGDPVPGAEVLAGNRMAIGVPVAILKAPITADENGYFEVAGLRPNQAHAVARVSEHDEYAASASVLAGQEEAVVELVAGRKLELLVIGADGEALSKLAISGRALPDDDANEIPDFLFPMHSLEHRQHVDNETHHMVISNLSASYWDLALRAKGHAVHREVFDIREADQRLEVRLKPERTVRLRVVRASDGEPVEHALVAASDSNSKGIANDRPLTTGRTSVEGFVELGGLTDGEASFTVTHPALAVTEVTQSVPFSEPLVVELLVGGRILGQVFENGEAPIEPMMIILKTRDGPDVAQAPRFSVSDLNGSFTFTNVQPGKVNVELRERMGSINLASPIDTFFVSELAREDLEVVAGEDHDVVLVVGSGADGFETGRVSGRLRVNGLPVQGWHLRTWGKLRRSATSTEDGSFELGLLAAGSVSIMVSAPGRSFMNGASTYTEKIELSEGDDRWVDINFDTGSLIGRVFDDASGAPLASATVTARAVQASDNEWFGGRHGTAISDADGFFEITDLSTGKYTADTKLKTYAKSHHEEVEIGPGRAPRIEVRLTKGWVIGGRIIVQGVDDEEPARWMWLTAEASDGREAAARPNDDLEYSFDDLGAGEWEFRLLSSHDAEFEPVKLRIDFARDDLDLVFSPVPPPEPVEPIGSDANNSSAFEYELR